MNDLNNQEQIKRLELRKVEKERVIRLGKKEREYGRSEEQNF